MVKPTFRLITVRISHYCEKVRWALTRLDISYLEECHLALLHRLKTEPLGGGSVPILVTKTGVFKDSTDILHYLDTIANPEAKLYPTESELCHEVVELENWFNRRLGVFTRQWGYFYILQDRSLMRQVWSDSAPVWEKLLFPIVFPTARDLTQRSYNIKFDAAMRAYRRTLQIFEKVGDRLSDGRGYLVGDCFSAADLTFASLAAPAVFPVEYGGALPKLDQVSSEMAEKIQELRQTPAGEYVLRLYREERNLTIKNQMASNKS